MQATVDQLTVNFNLGCEQPVSSETVCRELHRKCLGSWKYHAIVGVAVHKLLITLGNARLQVQWCKEHRQWITEQWRNVIWSDESSLIMFSPTRRVHVWHQPQELYNPECLLPTVKGSGGFVMLWGTFPSMVWVQSRSMPIAT